MNGKISVIGIVIGIISTVAKIKMIENITAWFNYSSDGYI